MTAKRPVTTESPVTTASPVAPGRHARRRWWHGLLEFFAGFSFAGLTGALIFYCLSLTPSLLPRAWYLQAVMSAVTAAIGYAIGLLVGWLARSLIPWRPGRTLRRIIRLSLAVAAIVLIPLFGVLGARWQHDIRELVEAPQPDEANYILVVLVTALLTFGLLMAARGIRWVVRQIARLVGRFVPDRAAAATVVLVICVVILLVLTGALSRGVLGLANSVFSGVDNSTAAGVTEPVSALRSGSPDSLVPWDTLGRQGRTFVAGGPTAAQISQFTGQQAMEPIRVYAGLKSAPSIEAESELAVKELERTGAFDRKVLVVATTTGTGWVNPAMIDPLEYMYGGDTAIAAIQYSFLPSWISFIADKAPAQEAGRDLFDAIYAQWSRLPADHRPKLVVFGESLGSFGGENAFSGVNDIRNRTSGVLWVGPTNSNTLWSRFTSDRDPGSPEWRPVYRDGTTVRFVTSLGQLNPVPADWSQPRVVYLQNTSDPIVWWSWSLAFHQPDWLSGPHPPDVSPDMNWYPLVTFWQVAADLALAAGVPAGHGHTYGMLQGASSWAAIIPPPGWTPERSAELGKLTAN
ncbi:MAG TPA: alpha/beta-hydrolase family protein [Trebonia sp.]|nr:alpha/beta-hydrolase family protein [Trebonia sp.]